jgi:transcriptional regulator with GAF, ATPase, and Fis domain
MESLKDRVKEIEKEEIINALKENNWVMARAARKLGITERMIGYKIKKYQIKREVKDIEGELRSNQ